MLKKLLSGIIAGTMLLSSMAMVASADELSDGIYVGSESFNTIDEAAVAANALTGDARKITVVGEVAVSWRQTIPYGDITLEGVNGGTLITSSSYANSSETNRKAVLTLSGTNIKVKDLTIDGGTYGTNLVPDSTANTQFSVVRVNSGSANFNNVVIRNSQRTLLTIGMSSSEADVTADNLYIEGTLKGINSKLTAYADVDIVDGDFIVNSGTVDGFIHDEDSSNTVTLPTGHRPLKFTVMYILTEELTTTVKHFAASYVNAKDAASSYIADFTTAANVSRNQTTIEGMVADAVASEDESVISNFITLLTDAKNAATVNSIKTRIQGYIDTLEGALASLQEV